jgi:hypothetical protein
MLMMPAPAKRKNPVAVASCVTLFSLPRSLLHAHGLIEAEAGLREVRFQPQGFGKMVDAFSDVSLP